MMSQRHTWLAGVVRWRAFGAVHRWDRKSIERTFELLPPQRHVDRYCYVPVFSHTVLRKGRGSEQSTRNSALLSSSPATLCYRASVTTKAAIAPTTTGTPPTTQRACRHFSTLLSSPPVALRAESADVQSAGSADPSRIAVIGAGQMGVGIAITAARMFALDKTRATQDESETSKVILFDVSSRQLANAKTFVQKWLAKEVDKKRITSEESRRAEALMGFSMMPGLSTDSASASSEKDRDSLTSVDFCIEAAPENFALKSQLIEVLDSLTPPHAVLATNTSSISITSLSKAASGRPEKVVGMHFMNPVPVMPLVEIIKGLATDASTLAATEALCRGMKKTPAFSLDRPGFVANRILMPYINEAVLTVQEGTATLEDVDTIMRLGTNVPMGPLRLADFIGLDTCLSIMKVLHRDFGDSKYRPACLLQQHVDLGWLGKKVGRGFYVYDGTA